MFKSISLENFRCFKKTNINGFSRINLIGGLNNAGKSALLESIIINVFPFEATINFLNNFRYENNDENYDTSWDYLFHNGKYDQSIRIKVLLNNGEFNDIYIKKEEAHRLDDLILYKNFDDSDAFSSARDDFVRFFNENKVAKSLNFYINKNDNLIPLSSCTCTEFGTLGQLDPENRNQAVNIGVSYRPSKQPIIMKDLIKLYEKSVANGHLNRIIEALHLIDSSIKDIRPLNNKLLLSRDNENYLPIGLFGDAIINVLDIALTFFSLPKESVLIIDEIENGIHHSKHELIWKFIYSISIERDIQVISTTHSIEMINAFNRISLSENVNFNEFSYIELARTRNNQIVGNLIEPEVLEYKIMNAKNFRGE